MKKYIFAAAAMLSAATFSACDDMLDTDPRVTSATAATFPGKIADVEALNAATYSIMNTMGGGDADQQNIWYWWEVMSDNCYGAGGLQDNKIKSLHHLTQMSDNQYETPFILLYGGINRANNMIETIDNVGWDGQMDKRNQLLGEAFFMRGLYYLWLTQLYGNVPLITSTLITPEMEEEADAAEAIFPQILSDFVSAGNLMGTQKSSGHANQYVARAFLARAYMFYEGFYGKIADLSTASPADIPLIEQEGSKGALSKQQVIDGLTQITGSGAYKLLDDYRSLWQYSNSYVWKEAHDAALDVLTAEEQKDLHNWAAFGNKEGGHAYAFIADMDPDNCFDMPGMGNGNDEELFGVQFMNASKWGIGADGGIYSSDRMYCNYLSCFWALRVNGHNGDRAFTYPFTQGWGQGAPSANIWDDWTIAENNSSFTDMRKLGSLIDGASANKEIDYDFVKDCCEAVGLGVKKYNGVTTDNEDGDRSWWYTAAGAGWVNTLGDNALQGSHFEDFYLMRYADVLLMHSELTGDPDGLNQVRERAYGYKLANCPQDHDFIKIQYSLEALQNQRRWEFAFEGLRFNDMRRWSGIDGGENCYAAKALQAQQGKQIINLGTTKGVMNHMTCSWQKRYADTNGFLAKPQSQITLMNGKLKQNAGWDYSNTETQYKTLY